MATETKTKARTSKPTKETSPAEEVVEVVKKPIIAKDIDLNQLIAVRNGYQGRLVYKSPRTHEKFVRPEFGT